MHGTLWGKATMHTVKKRVILHFTWPDELQVHDGPEDITNLLVVY